MSRQPQSTDTVVMIRPYAFRFNPDTAPSNRYQAQEAPEVDSHAAALAEFDGLVGALRRAGVDVIVVDDTPEPATPDSLFPNNWFSTHEDGRILTYPMLAPSRRGERRDDLAALLASRGRTVSAIVDFSSAEAKGVFVEGTGSLVFDRQFRVAYACESARTDPDGVRRICAELGYQAVLFRAEDVDGQPIYHTNVCLAIGTNWVIFCAEAIADTAERARVLSALAQSGREIVPISQAQVAGFCGNALELRSTHGTALIAMSARAMAALTDSQRLTLSRHAHIVHASVDHIETLAGGSVRCMLAEIFLPRRV